MGDQLEQFIMNNRDSFDDSRPSDKVWQGIDNKINKKKDGFLHIVWRVAAVIFMATTVYLLIERNMKEAQVEIQFSQEFVEAEGYYTQLISLKQQEIKEKLTPEQQSELFNEIDQLDNLYLDLKKTYQENAASERVLAAMISNLQLRLNILNKQLEILENIKDQNDESDETLEI